MQFLATASGLIIDRVRSIVIEKVTPTTHRKGWPHSNIK
jgi:hypothetical protein